MKSHKILTVVLLIGLSPGMNPASAQPAGDSNPWQNADVTAQSRFAAEVWIQPPRFRGVQLNPAALVSILNRAPRELSAAVTSPTGLTLPMPDGTDARFHIEESPVMEPELAAKFPEIKTYIGRGIDDPAASARIDWTPAGFHAQILSPRGAVYIDPQFRGDIGLYASYYKRDYPRGEDGFECLVSAEASAATVAAAGDVERSGDMLRTYRLACAATGEYTQFHGGTVSAGMAAIVTAVNRLNGIYETELAVRLVLVGNNNLIVYTNSSTDPYNNSSGSTMLGQNQSNLDSVIGSANYDIGHVFSTGGGGIATLGCVCVNSLKARGVTGLASPIGDPFYVDYVAHEMGHQFGANHTFNSTTGSCSGNRNSSTAYEPGSGSTILAYAGICSSDNLQSNSDPYFHSISFDEILTYITSGSGGSCPVLSGTGNTAPAVSAGPNYTIPQSTPFTLTASGNDPNNDPLTYCWEERDLGAAQTLTAADNGSSPLFRSFNPATSPSRTFPRLQNILNNTTSLGEKLPTTSRTLNFRVTARDNRAGGGGVNTANMQVTVSASSGPFVVTSPNTSVLWSGLRTVTWDVAGTASSPVNATHVNILLSTNGGLDFPVVLAAATPNDGAEEILLPNLTTSSARVKVEAAGNIFFDVSNSNFSIEPATPVARVVVESAVLVSESCGPANNAIDPFEVVTVEFALKNSGTTNADNVVVTLLETGGISAPSGPQVYGALAAGGPAVTNAFSFTANGSCGGVINAVLQVQDGSENLGTITNVLALGSLSAASTNFSNPDFIKIPNTGSSGAASPYPSLLSVSGLSGAVSKVTVTLSNLSHTFPDDLDILLVGPTGAKLLLLSDAGGSGDINNVTLTFDDAAAIMLDNSSQIVSGNYLPSDHGAGDTFPSPAPSGPYASTLSAFNGLDPNGNWSLFITDDSGADTGGLNNGWALSFVVSNAVCCTASNVADLAISTANPYGPVNVGGMLNYVLTVTNSGPSIAVDATVINSLPAGVSFVEATASQGNCTNDNGTVTCALGALSAGASATINIAVTAGLAGAWTNTAVVFASTGDPDTTNNAIPIITLINATPFISAIANQVTDEDIAAGPIAFEIGDAETAAETLVLAAGSSDTNLVADENIIFGGSGSNRTVTLTASAEQSGVTTITLTVSDGLATNQTMFDLTVLPVNDPPTLAAITNQVVTEETLLSLVAEATDVDSSPENLSFSLTGDAPSGAVIGSTNGVFTWTPDESQGPGTNVISVVVTDDGVPSMSATQSFTVVVLETNAAPELAAIAGWLVHAGALITFTNLATDSDLPANQLSFSLDPGFPAGADVGAANGIFSWTPADEQAETTNTITVRVADDGDPPLDDAQTFTVTVVGRPIIEMIVVTGADVELTWSAIPGVTYRAQFKNDLDDPVWTDLPGDVTAISESATYTDTISGTDQRFYRIVTLP